MEQITYIIFKDILGILVMPGVTLFGIYRAPSIVDNISKIMEKAKLLLFEIQEKREMKKHLSKTYFSLIESAGISRLAYSLRPGFSNKNEQVEEEENLLGRMLNYYNVAARAFEEYSLFLSDDIENKLRLIFMDIMFLNHNFGANIAKSKWAARNDGTSFSRPIDNDKAYVIVDSLDKRINELKVIIKGDLRRCLQ